MEVRGIPRSGLMSSMLCLIEWFYHAEQTGTLIWVNMTQHGPTVTPGLFEGLFEPVLGMISSARPIPGLRVIENFQYQLQPTVPWNETLFQGLADRDGSQLQTINNRPHVYTLPAFQIVRERAHPIATKYLRPNASVRERIDRLMSHLPPSDRTIGFLVRCRPHSIDDNGFAPGETFIADILKDMDEIMSKHDPERTNMFLATLLEPVCSAVRAKYPRVITADYPRGGIDQDWTELAYHRSFEGAKDIVVDTWVLSRCDEIWCPASFIALVAGCLNPRATIHLLPSLAQRGGG